MNSTEILEHLRQIGSETTARVLKNHGAHDPCYGVKIGDLKPIQKKIKSNYELSLELYESGIYDAMYLAGLIAAPKQMTKEDLQDWMANASKLIASYVVGPIASASPTGWELGASWIKSAKPIEKMAGWATFAAMASTIPDEQLDLSTFEALLSTVERDAHAESPDVAYQMNAFIISTGSCIRSLSAQATEVGHRIGPLELDMGNTSCAVPFAPDYIAKVEARGAIGKKRKSAMC